MNQAQAYVGPSASVTADGDIDVHATAKEEILKVAAAYAEVATNGEYNALYVNGLPVATNPFDGTTPSTQVGDDPLITTSLALADLDGDGDMDLVAGSFAQAARRYLNDGTGVFTNGSVIGGNVIDSLVTLDLDKIKAAVIPPLTLAIATADLDNDGDQDVITANFGQPNRIFYNNGSGGFGSGAGFVVGAGTIPITIPVSATNDNTTVADLVIDVLAAIQAALTSAGLPTSDVTVAVGNGDGAATLVFDSVGRVVDGTALLAAIDAVRVDGRLVANVPFTLNIVRDSVTIPVSGTITAASTSTNTTAADLAADVQAAVRTALTAAGRSIEDITVTTDALGQLVFTLTARNLGSVRDAEVAIEASRNAAATTNKLVASPGSNSFVFRLPYGGRFVDVSVAPSATSSNTSIADLVADIQTAVNTALVAAAMSAGDIVVFANLGKITFRAATISLDPASVATTQANILQQRVDGRISAAVSAVGLGLSEEERTTSVAVGDLNGDAKLDIVFGNLGQRSRVYLNKGDGTFHFGKDLSTYADYTTSVALADLDGDGDLDLVVGNIGLDLSEIVAQAIGDVQDFVNNTVLLIDNLVGSLLDPLVDLLGAGLIDTDSFDPLALIDIDQLLALLGLDLNAFDPLDAVELILELIDLGIIDLGDLPGDFELPLDDILDDPSTSAVDGFVGEDEFEELGLPTTGSLGLGDVLGSTTTDLEEVLEELGDTVSETTGLTLIEEVIDTVLEAITTLIEILDGGTIDLDALINGSLLQLDDLVVDSLDLNSVLQSGLLDLQTLIDDGLLSITDLVDLDGIDPLSFASQFAVGGASRVYLNNGNGTFAAPTTLGTRITKAIATGDVDGDGDIDIVLGNIGVDLNVGVIPATGSQLFENNGSATFTATEVGDAAVTTAVALVDIDADNVLDLLMANLLTGNKAYLGNGDGTFGPALSIGTEKWTTLAIVAADLTGDTKVDIVTGNALPNIAAAGSVNVATITDRSKAYVGLAASVHADDDVDVRATGHTDVMALAGGIAQGDDIGIGLSVTNMNFIRDVAAYVQGALSVQAGNDNTKTDAGLSVVADATDDIFSYAAGNSDATTLTLAASLVLNTMLDLTQAFIDGSTVTVAPGAGTRKVLVHAEHTTNLVSLSGANSQADELAVGAAADIEILTRQVFARIGPLATVTAPDEIEVSTLADGTNLHYAVGTGGSFVLAVAGSLLVIVATDIVRATVTGATLNADVVTVTATDSSVVRLDAGGNAFVELTDTSGIAFGASVSIGVITNIVQAIVDGGAVITAPDGITIAALSDGEVESLSVAGGGAAATGDVGLALALAGTLSINIVNNVTEAVVRGVGTSLTSTNAGVSVHATDTVVVNAEAGAAALSRALSQSGGTTVTVGAAIALNVITSVVTASVEVITLTTVVSAPDLSVVALSDGDINSEAIGIAGTASSRTIGGLDIAAGGSLSFNALNSVVTARLGLGKIVAPTVTVSATSSGDIDSDAGGVAVVKASTEAGDLLDAIGLLADAVSNNLGIPAAQQGVTDALSGAGAVGIAIGASFAFNFVNAVTTSVIYGAEIDAVDYVHVYALSDGVITSLTTAGAGPKFTGDTGLAAGGAGAVSLNKVTSLTSALVTAAGTDITVTAGPLEVIAQGLGQIHAKAGAEATGFALAFTAGIPVTAAVAIALNEVNQTVTALIEAITVGAAITADAITVKALADADIHAKAMGTAGSFAGAIIAGVAVGAGGSLTVNSVVALVLASIGAGHVVADTVEVDARTISDIQSNAGGIGLALAGGFIGGAAAAIGAAIGANYITSSTTALVAGADIDAVDWIKVNALSDGEIDTRSLAVSVAAGGGLVIGASLSGAGAISVNVVTSNTNAIVQGVGSSLTTSSPTGYVHVTATDDVDIDALSGAGAVGFALALGVAATAGVGAAIAYNQVIQVVTATLASTAPLPVLVSTDVLIVRARSTADVDAVAIGIAGTVGAALLLGAGVSVAGSLAVNNVISTVTATVGIGHVVARDVTVEATNDNDLQTDAGGLGLALGAGLVGGVSAAFGVSVAFNMATQVTTAIVIGADIDATENIRVVARSDGSIKSYTLAGSAGLGAGFILGVSLAGAGALSLNFINSTTNALVQGLATSLTVTRSSGNATTGNVSVSATDDADIFAIAGAAAAGISVGLLSGSASFAAAIAYNSITQVVTATVASVPVTGIDLVNADKLDVKAKAEGQIHAIAIGLAYSSAGGVLLGISIAAGGSATVNFITASVVAALGPGHVDVAGTVLVEATNDASIRADSGGFAIARAQGAGVAASAAVGISAALNTLTLSTIASIAGADVDAGGNIDVKAKTDGTIEALTIAGALPLATNPSIVGLAIAGAGAISINTVTSTTNALVVGAASTLDTPGAVSVTADDEVDIDAYGGALALGFTVTMVGGTVSVGAAIAINTITQVVTATVASTGTAVPVVDAASLLVHARSDADIDAITIGIAGASVGGSILGIAVAAGGSVSVNTITSTVFATLGLGNVITTGGVTVEALNNADINADGGGVGVAVAAGGAIGASAAVGVSAAFNTITSATTALVLQTDIDAGGAVLVKALSDGTIFTVTIAGSVAVAPSAIVGLAIAGAGALSINTVTSATNALVVGVGTSITGSSVTVFADDRVSIFATAGALAFGFSAGVVSGTVSVGAAIAVNNVTAVVNALMTSVALPGLSLAQLTSLLGTLSTTVQNAITGGLATLTPAALSSFLNDTPEAIADLRALLDELLAADPDITGALSDLVAGGLPTLDLVDLLNNGPASITGPDGPLSPLFAALGDVKGALGDVFGAIDGLVNDVRDAFGTIVGLIGDLQGPVEMAIDQVVTILKTALAQVKGGVDTFVNALKAAVAGVGSVTTAASLSGAPIGITVDANSLTVKAESRASIKAFGVGMAGSGAGGSVVGLAVGAGGSISLNAIANTVLSAMAGVSTVRAGITVGVTALDDSSIFAFAGAAGLAVGAGVAAASVGIGVSVAINRIGGAGALPLDIGSLINTPPSIPTIPLHSVRAVLAASTIGQSGSPAGAVTVSATNSAEIVAITVAGGVGFAGGVAALSAGLAGGVSVNSIGAAVDALVVGGTIRAASVSVTATDSSQIFTIVGAAAAGIAVGAVGGGLAGAGAIAVNTIAVDVKASVSGGATVESAGAVLVRARSSSTIDSYGLGLAGALGGGVVGIGLGVAGSLSVNRIGGTVEASLVGSSVTTATGQNISVLAENSSEIRAAAGGVALGAAVGAVGVSVGFGVSIADNTISTVTRALIDGGTTLAGGTLTVSATRTGKIHGIAMGGGAALAVAAVAVAVAVGQGLVTNTITGTTEAVVRNVATYAAARGAVTISASDTAKIDAFAIGGAFSFAAGIFAGGVSLAGSKATNSITGTVSARVQSATVISATAGVSVTASSNADIDANSDAVAIASTAGLSISVAATGAEAVNTIARRIEANVTAGSKHRGVRPDAREGQRHLGDRCADRQRRRHPRPVRRLVRHRQVRQLDHQRGVGVGRRLDAHRRRQRLAGRQDRGAGQPADRCRRGRRRDHHRHRRLQDRGELDVDDRRVGEGVGHQLGAPLAVAGDPDRHGRTEPSRHRPAQLAVPGGRPGPGVQVGAGHGSGSRRLRGPVRLGVGAGRAAGVAPVGRGAHHAPGDERQPGHDARSGSPSRTAPSRPATTPGTARPTRGCSRCR